LRVLVNEGHASIEQRRHYSVVIGDEDDVFASGIRETCIPIREQANVRFLGDDAQSWVAKFVQGLCGIVGRSIVRNEDFEMGVGLRQG
jgi:hypothetical protein